MESNKSVKCPNCLNLVSENSESCPNCTVDFYVCSKCNALVLGKDTVCRNCNSKLYGKETDDFFDRIPERLFNFLVFSAFIITVLFLNQFLRKCT